MNKLICITGLCGSGKSEVTRFFMEKGLPKVYFGQITFDEMGKRGIPVNEANEKKMREDLRKEYGMGAYAILNFQKFDAGLEKDHTLGDGLYSYEEFEALKDRYGDRVLVIAVYASPRTRYSRMEGRENDSQLGTVRKLTAVDAAKRDDAELRNLNKGATIAMADYTIVNEGSAEELRAQAEKIWKKIMAK